MSLRRTTPSIPAMEHAHQGADGEPAASTETSGRRTGIALLVLAAATLGLLHSHPSPEAATFTDMLRGEAANRIVDAVVHGGFIVVLAAQLACMAILMARIGTRRPAAIVALVLMSAGTAALMLSMALDGLVVPAIATRYVAASDRQGEAKALFVLLGTMIRFLMPGGLLFQAAGLVAWGVAIRSPARLARSVRWLGVVAGAAVIAAVGLSAGAIPALIGSMLLIGAWLALVGVALVLGRL